ncbi:MAG TPA: CBS domain-containing protein [Roseiflexaceae bacterium]|nr:CBS domain-containing protein [Roseiflexaceae bacterium]
MCTVRHLLNIKGNEVWTVTPETSVFDALKLMADKNIGAVVVMDGEQVAGIMTERDYARKVILQSKTSKETQVREIMTPAVLYVHPEQHIEECMAIMDAKRIRHLLVLEEGRLVGMVSMRDVVKQIIDEREFLIDQLEHYITQ